MTKLYVWYANVLDSFRKDEEGQTMAEYGVILAVITAGVLLALVTLSGNVQSVIERVGNAIT